MDAQRSLAAGVLDEAAYQHVLELNPGHAEARRVLAALEPPPPAPRDRRTSWAIVAAALFTLLGAGLLWRSRGEPPAVDPLEETLEAPSFDDDDATLADSTLPG